MTEEREHSADWFFWMESMDNNTLINARAMIMTDLEQMNAVIGRIDYELQRRMENDRATAIPHDDFIVELKPSGVSFDQSKLMGILELVDPALAESSGAYIPEHQQTVPAKWNVTKAKTLAKYNGEIGDLIADARIEGRFQLSIKPKG